jgi:hypothetical protein
MNALQITIVAGIAICVALSALATFAAYADNRTDSSN